MASKETTIKKGHRLWLGNYPFLLTSDATGIFESVSDSPDALAEALATNSSIYAAHKDDLAHDEDGFENVSVQRMQPDGKTPVLDMAGRPVFDIEAKPVKIHVTYGLNGAREEHKKGDKTVIDQKKQTAEQKKNVADADAAMEKDAKKQEKMLTDPELTGTPLATLALIKEDEKKKAEAKGLADDKARRDLEIADHNRPGGATGPVA